MILQSDEMVVCGVMTILIWKSFCLSVKALGLNTQTNVCVKLERNELYIYMDEEKK